MVLQWRTLGNLLCQKVLWAVLLRKEVTAIVQCVVHVVHCVVQSIKMMLASKLIMFCYIEWDRIHRIQIVLRVPLNN